MTLNQILLAVIAGGLFVVMMYMFIRVLFLPSHSSKDKPRTTPPTTPKASQKARARN